MQLDALYRVGCARSFTDHASGAVTARPELNRLLQVVLPGVGLTLLVDSGSGGFCRLTVELFKPYRREHASDE